MPPKLAKLALRLFVIIGMVAIGATPLQAEDLVDPVRQQIELGPFLDQFFADQLDKHGIPGATIAVIEGGELVYARGYGISDVSSGLPVTADQTLFRIASVSKLIVATAVMQLVEARELDLHTDVNEYLKNMQLEASFPGPVTLHHLLTHTAGFDDRYLGSLTLDEADRMTLGEYLSKRMPPRVMPVGVVTSYSNHGSALAAYIVEEVSGLTFSTYTKRHILNPLEMNDSGYLVNDEMRSKLATAYDPSNNRLRAFPYDYFHRYPPSSFMSTATDMARFIMAHLNDGQIGESRILGYGALTNLQRRQFVHHPEIAGMAYGFFESFANGKRMLSHDGSTSGFNSELVLIPEDRTGWFVSTNSRSGGKLTRALRDALVARWSPGGPPVYTLDPIPSPNLGQFAGAYQYNRYSRTTLEKIVMLVNDKLIIEATDAGLVALDRSYVQTSDMLFQNAETGHKLAFKKDEHGDISHLLLGPFAYEKTVWHQQNWFQFGLLGTCLLTFAVTMLWGILTLIVPRFRASRTIPAQSLWFATLVSLFSIALSVGLFTILSSDAVVERMRSHVPPIVLLLLVGGLLLSLFAIVAAFLSGRLWLQSDVGLLSRVVYLTFALACIGLVWFLDYWNLLGFRYPA